MKISRWQCSRIGAVLSILYGLPWTAHNGRRYRVPDWYLQLLKQQLFCRDGGLIVSRQDVRSNCSQFCYVNLTKVDVTNKVFLLYVCTRQCIVIILLPSLWVSLCGSSVRWRSQVGLPTRVTPSCWLLKFIVPRR